MKIKHQLLLPVLLCFLTTVVVSADYSHPSKPNIMVFLVDDMGVMDTSVPFLTDAAGEPKTYPLNKYYRTPQMARLAQQGIRFNQFYAMSVCSPTRISIMTGQNAARHRATNWINPSRNNRGGHGPHDWQWKGLKKSDVTLPGLLREQGYKTIHIGKAHFGPRGAEGSDPLNLGFDINVGGAAFGSPGSYLGKKNYGHGTKTHLSEALTIEAKKHVSESVNSETPFFLYFAHYAVHAPFESDVRFAKHYTKSGKPASAQAFATLIEGMDKSLGDMLDHFEKLGISDNTLVVFLGDNGTDAPLGHQHAVACAAPLRGKKGAHYEGGMRVPFIAAWAKPNSANRYQKQLPIAQGAIQSQLASVTDLFPSLLALVGSQIPDSHTMDGNLLGKLFTGKPDPARPQSFLMHYPHGPHRSNYFTVLWQDDWKVIYHYPVSTRKPGKRGGKKHGENTTVSDVMQPRYELFNLKQDPFEQTNVASAQPDKLRSMMNALVKNLQQKKALMPEKNGKPILPVVP
ncbi:MAG: sulfatase-like hydrolase/transferase [Verrucomicrobiae bacterium]|nr:sulfatase-like hydrolase/transferase [Verrucomicrobiae bacterium]NNJ87504.1 sulfatase-like hydrolase/transferase [Akkermansiaceae bacterium]